MERIKQIIHVLFAMSGILIDKINHIRILQIFVIIAIFLFYKTVLSYTGFRIALCCFIFAWAVRYIFLFSVIPRKHIRGKDNTHYKPVKRP
jgi:hypothetical protein